MAAATTVKAVPVGQVAAVHALVGASHILQEYGQLDELHQWEPTYLPHMHASPRAPVHTNGILGASNAR